MKISRITAWQKSLPLKKPYWLSGGRLKFEELDSTFVRLECDNGSIGWGEGCPWGNTYLPAFGAGIRAALDLLAPALLGQDPADIARLNQLMDETLPGHPYAKSALDIALWDLFARKAGVPLYQALGGGLGESVEANSSIATGEPAQMIADIEDARALGYRYHSAKIGGKDPGVDIARIEAIDEARVAGEYITYDVNRAWTPATAIEVMNTVSTNNWFEQPCETLSECALVQNNTRQNIMLDECLHTFEDHLNAWKLGACQGVKVKPNRLGGISKARQVRDFGVSVGWQMHIEDVGGTVLADTAAIHLAYSTPEANRLGSWLCHQHLVDDFCEGQGARNDGGDIRLSDSPGLGIEPPEDWLGAPSKVY